MSHIKTFARIRPTNNIYDDFDVTPNCVYIRVPEHVTSASLWGGKSRQKNVVNHEFKFDHVFRERATQSEVFDKVAVSVIQGFLSGYNGTIFAYGQTGSGKTFTVEGGAQRYEHRGLAPRALSMIYKALEARTEEEIQVKVSYMEIYHEIGYDLLNTAARTSSVVTPFPKVAVVEGAKGSCIIRNLSMHLAANEDVAQNLLFQGQANRKVAETTMNQRSSRSHAVFTIYLTAKQPNSDVIVKSKLHLVDLAGSERVSKTGTIGLQLNEAKFINLSLHYLEGVIIALQQEASGQASRQARPFSSTSVDCRLYNRQKVHKSLRYSPYGDSVWRWVNQQRPSTAMGYANPKYVPYRNSLLTMVLRDSLGGNCETAMIATVSMEPVNLCESLSTCRFAQRVACITNTLRKNEEIDDKSMIRRLRKRIVELETQLCAVREGQNPDEASLSTWSLDSKLTDEDKLECARIVEAYLSGRLKDPVMAGITNPVKFRECLQLLRRMIQESGSEPTRPFSAPPKPQHPTTEASGRPGVQRAWDDESPTQDQNMLSKGLLPNKRSDSHASLQTNSTLTGSTLNIPPTVHELGSQTSVQTASTIIDKYMANSDSRPASGSTLRSEVISEYPETPTPTKAPNDSKSGNTQNLRSNRQNHPYMNGKTLMQVMKAHGSMGSLSGSANGSRTSLRGSKSSLRNSRRSLASNPQPMVSGPVNGRASGYKSPFEKAREREIRTLDKKVERRSEAIRGQQQNIEALQHDVRYQKLVLLKNEISPKLEKTQQQLKEQQLFLNRLRDARSASNILDQELLVEKQLKKREHKMQARLKLIEEQINQEKARHENQTREDNTPPENPKPTATSKKEPAARNGGKVNSRAVLEMLQAQEKQQTKVASRLEKEKILTLSEHVQVKEAATRQKLQEFRDKLKKSSLGNNTAEPQPSSIPHSADHYNPFIDIKPPVFDQSADGPRVPDPFASQDNFGRLQSASDSALPNASEKPRNTSDTSLFETNARKPPVESRSSSSKKQLESNTQSAGSNNTVQHNTNAPQKSHLSSSSTSSFSKLLSGSQNSSSANNSVLLQNLLNKHKSSETHSQKAAKAWDSAYSREPSRPQTQESINLGSASAFTQVHNTQIQFTSSAIQPEGYEDLPHVDWLHVEHSQNDSTHHSPPNVSESGFSAKEETLPGYFANSVRKHVENIDPSHSRATSQTFGLEPKPNHQSMTKSSNTSGSVLSFGSENETDSFKLSHRHQKHSKEQATVIALPCNGTASSGWAEEKSKPPTNTEGQDSKPKTSSQVDFDLALQKMLLGDHIPKSITTATKDDYDIYAREKPGKSKSLPVDTNTKTPNKSQPRDATKSRSPYSAGAKVPTKTPMSKTQPARNARLWGPEAKFMSVSERLRDFESTNTAFTLSGKSKDDAALNLKKPTRITEETTDGLSGEWKKNITKAKPKPEIDLDKYKIKIRAINEDSREQTYESTVKHQRDRVARIRQARGAAEIIQRAWRKYQHRLLRRK